MRHFLNLDSNESIFFERELEHVKAKSYDVQFPLLKALTLIPISTEAGPGAESITYQQYEDIGIARIIAGYGDDLERADVKGREFSSIVKTIGDSYGWNVQEIQAAIMAGKGLTQRRAVAARRAFDQLVDQLAWFGDAEAGLQGLLRHPNITTGLVVQNAGATSTLWVNKTPDEILTDMNDAVIDIIDLTNEIEAPDTIMLPVAQYGLIATTPRSSTSDTTILNFFLATSPYITSVVPVNRLKAVTPVIVGGGDSSDIMVVYPKNPDVLTLELPQPFTQLAPQERGLEYIVPCYGRYGGIIIYRPLAITIKEGI